MSADVAIAPARGRVGSVVDQLLAPANEQIIQIPIDLIEDHPRNAPGRTDDVDDLVAGIKEVGVMYPAVVATAEAYNAGKLPNDPEADPGHYVIVGGGHRRKAAARKAGLTDLPCVVRDHLADAKGRKNALLENLHRLQLSPLDEADAFAELRDLYGVTQQQLADTIGCTQPHISKRLLLPKLPAGIKSRIGVDPASGGVTVDQAVQIARLPVSVQNEITSTLQSKSSFTAGTVPMVIREESEAHERRTVRNKAVKALKAIDVPILNVTGDQINDDVSYSRTNGPAPLPWIYTGLDAQAQYLEHASLPCHAAVISRHRISYDDTLDAHEQWISYVCTDPASHASAEAPAGASVGSDVELEAQSRKAARDVLVAELTAASEARRGFMRALIHRAKMPTITAHVIRGATVDGIFDRITPRAPDAAELLGEDGAYLEPLTETLDGSDDTNTAIAKFAFAGRLASDDTDVTTAIGLDVEARAAYYEDCAIARWHLRFLTAHGYDPHPREQALLDDTRFTFIAAAYDLELPGLQEPTDEQEPSE